ncbi:MAG: hypothetical protein WBI04_01990 [Trichlorobacter sp.]|jgi:hypothetical protein
MNHVVGFTLLLILADAAPALAVTERLFPMLPGAVIELCRPNEEDTPCIESPNLRMRYSSANSQKQAQRELLAASRRLGWRMYPLKGEPGRFQSANAKRPWDLLWDLRPAPADQQGPGYHIYYWKITGQ